jgi:hypothetical protein
MKRWAILTVLLYGIFLALLSAPLVTVCSLGSADPPNPGLKVDVSFSQALQIFQEWSFWIWLGVLLTAQGVLLLVPLDLSQKRLKPRAHVLVPIGVSSFLLANLLFAALGSLLVGVFNEKGFEAFANLPEVFFQNRFSQQFFAAIGVSTVSKSGQFALMCFQILGVFWLLWGFIFYRFARNDSPETLLNRITKWLLYGSILDLLVAVPSHVIVRSKQNCCAPAASLWGIATGLSVMLLAFGPGVFFLFVKRMNRLKPKTPLAANPPEIKPAG